MIKVYDLNMNLVAYLENAFSICYEQRMNELWVASFSLPADDPKNEECLPLRYVEIFDGEERIDLFRIIPTRTQRSTDSRIIEYQCEHVLATLLDDVLFQYHQVGGLGFYTADAIQYVLDQQSTVRWQLGTTSFNHQFEYKWENENLLGSIFSIPKPFLGDYHWTWDTSTTPWTLNLVEPESAEPSCYIRYGKNLIGITKEEDPTHLCTRLYCLGYGEGVNQLKISEVNAGLPYLDSDTLATYGVISSIFTDKRIENAETLKARGQAILEGMKIPRITYSVNAAELYQLTEDTIDKFVEGALVRVIDEELGIDIISRVVSVRKPNVEEEPWNVQIEIANKTANIAGSIAELENRQRINEVYAQGSTNLDSHDFADNCDPDNPAIIRFYIPAETIRINKMTLSYESSAFRAYSKAIQSAPAVSSSQVSAGGSDILTFYNLGGPFLSGHVKSQDGTTSYDLAPHTHAMPLHSHTIPSHTHEIEYGIFEGPSPTSLIVEIDGNSVAGLGVSEDEVDIIPYLSKDTEGKVNRGVWHEIKITPNDLGRIVANVVTQLFVQSRGGGNY